MPTKESAISSRLRSYPWLAAVTSQPAKETAHAFFFSLHRLIRSFIKRDPTSRKPSPERSACARKGYVPTSVLGLVVKNDVALLQVPSTLRTNRTGTIP